MANLRKGCQTYLSTVYSPLLLVWAAQLPHCWWCKYEAGQLCPLLWAVRVQADPSAVSENVPLAHTATASGPKRIRQPERKISL